MTHASEAAGLGWLAFEDEPMTVHEVKLRLAEIYEVHNPEKLLTLDKELEKNQGHEEKLLRRVLGKYEPEEFERDMKQRQALRIRKQLFNVIQEHNMHVLNPKQIVSVVEALLATQKVPCREDGGGDLNEEERVLQSVIASYSIVDEKLRGPSTTGRPTADKDGGKAKAKGHDESDDDRGVTINAVGKTSNRKLFSGERNLHHKSYLDGVTPEMPKRNVTSRRQLTTNLHECAPFSAAAMVAFAPLADQSLNVLSTKEQIYTMMQKYNPMQVPKLQHYLDVHQIEEEELLDLLRQKYEPGPWAARRNADEQDHQDQNAITMRLLQQRMKDEKRDDDRRAKEMKKEEGPPSPKDVIRTKFGPVPKKYGRFGACDDLRAQVYFILAKGDPSRLSQLDKLMAEYKYREETLIRELREEYEGRDFVVSEIKRYMRTYLPEKVAGGEDEALLIEHRGQEQQLLASLKRDFHGIPVPCTSAAMQERKDDEEQERSCEVSGCVQEVLPGKGYCETHICTMCFENRRNPSLGMCMVCDLKRQGIVLDGAKEREVGGGGGGDDGAIGTGAPQKEHARFKQVLLTQRRTKQFLKAAERTFRFISVRIEWDLRRRYFRKLRRFAEKSIKRQHEQFYHNLLFNPDVDLRKREHRIRHRKGQCHKQDSDCDEELSSGDDDVMDPRSNRATHATRSPRRMETLEDLIDANEVDEETFYTRYISLQLNEEDDDNANDDADSDETTLRTGVQNPNATSENTPLKSILKSQSKLTTDTATAGELIVQGKQASVARKKTAKKAHRIVLYCGARLEAVLDEADPQQADTAAGRAQGYTKPAGPTYTMYYTKPPDPLSDAKRALKRDEDRSARGRRRRAKEAEEAAREAPERLPVVHLMYCSLSRALYVRCEERGEVVADKIPIQFDRNELERFQDLADLCSVPHDLAGDGDRTDRVAALLLRSADRFGRHRPWEATPSKRSLRHTSSTVVY